MVAAFTQECLQMLGHYLVKDGLFGLMALVFVLRAFACAQGDRTMQARRRMQGSSGNLVQDCGGRSESCAESIESLFLAFFPVAGVANCEYTVSSAPGPSSREQSDTQKAHHERIRQQSRSQRALRSHLNIKQWPTLGASHRSTSLSPIFCIHLRFSKSISPRTKGHPVNR